MNQRYQLLRSSLFFIGLAVTLLWSSISAQSLRIEQNGPRVRATVNGRSVQIRPTRDLNGDGIRDYVLRAIPGLNGFARPGKYIVYGKADKNAFTVDPAVIKPAEGRFIPTFPTFKGATPARQNIAGKTAAGEPQMVVDLSTIPMGILPMQYATYDGDLYFSAFDPDTGYELYRREGSTAVLVSDIAPGPASSMPMNLMVHGPHLMFLADNPETGTELYMYDGSDIMRLTDLTVGPGSSLFDSPVVVDGKVFFVAQTEEGSFLYQFDGSTVEPVIDAETTMPIEEPSGLMTFADQLLYFAPGDDFQEHLYSFLDGNVTELETLSDPIVVEGSAYATVDGKLYFAADFFDPKLMVYDGTGVTALVAEVGGVTLTDFTNLTAVDSRLFFTAESELVGTELFAFDGTSFSLAGDLLGDVSSEPTSLIEHDGSLYFVVVDDDIDDVELYRHDGTTLTAWSDIENGTSLEYPVLVYSNGTNMFATAFDFDTGFQLWEIDGNTSNRITSHSESTQGSWPSNLTVFGNELYFSGAAGLFGEAIFVKSGNNIEEISLGEDVGSREVVDVAPMDNAVLVVLHDFEANTYETRVLKNGSATVLSTMEPTSDIVLFDNGLYLSLRDGETPAQLYRYDVTGLALVPDAASLGVSDVSEMIVYEGNLYVAGSTETTSGLYQYVDGTFSLVDQGDLEGASQLTASNGLLYYLATEMFMPTLVAYDGTTATAVDLGVMPVCFASPACVVGDGAGSLYFVGISEDSNPEIFRFSEGTSTQITNRGPSEPLWFPQELTYAGGKLYFHSWTEGFGMELMVWDGTEVTMVADIYPGAGSSLPGDLVVLGTDLYFRADDPFHGPELWSLDVTGTATEGPGAQAVFALAPGYPNPTRTQTHVSFTVPKPADVRIDLYDVLGRKVTTVVDRSYTAGTHAASFDAGTLGSGTYFLRMSADGQVFVRSLVVAH